MNGAELDPASKLAVLGRLLLTRSRFRISRTLDRMRSPRRIVATTLTCLFLLNYFIAGWLILSTRTPQDPEQLGRWLSGWMVLYAIYHCARCAWSKQTTDLEMSPAEDLWLTGAPLKASSIAIHQVAQLVVPTAMKTLLLSVALAVDVQRYELLCLGIFSTLLAMELIRLAIFRWFAGLSSDGRRRFRTAITAIVVALIVQVVCRVVATTPLGSPVFVYVMHAFTSLGDAVGSTAFQILSWPWSGSAKLAIAPGYGGLTWFKLLTSFAMLPTMVWVLVRVDTRSRRKVLDHEKQRLAEGVFLTRRQNDSNSVTASVIWSNVRPLNHHGTSVNDWWTMMSRQWASVKRYRATIFFSFVVPTLLCLSPLLTAQKDREELWFFIVSGTALCTVLLAPPALRIDFRRDLKRMLLLKSLPVKPISMVLGQLTIPVVITWMFQWVTLLVAAIVTGTAWHSVFMWTGILSALAIFTFAIENALFLAYPHHERAEGLAMMIRAKLTFLGKGAVLMASLVALGAWAVFCGSTLPEDWVVPALIGGAITVTWSLAMLSIAVATWCWRRFDLSLDLPPE